jgi:hypothetical protein
LESLDQDRFRDRCARYLLGLRKGFGEGRDAIHTAQLADTRGKSNWVIPGLGAGLLLILLIFTDVQGARSPHGGMMMFRVFVFDYLIFLMGALSGWNMARRWRANAAQVEELSLSPLAPKVIGHVMASGPIRVWLLIMCMFAVVDLFTPSILLGELYEIMDSGAEGATLLFQVMYLLSIGLILPIVMAWFHFESIRLGHWMFAIHAMPKISLGRASVLNFIIIGLFVVMFSALGSAITGPLAVLMGFLREATANAMTGNLSYLGYYGTWAFGTIPGALAVIFCKRALIRTYESSFAKNWLFYQWHGAGESQQPRT